MVYSQLKPLDGGSANAPNPKDPFSQSLLMGLVTPPRSLTIFEPIVYVTGSSHYW